MKKIALTLSCLIVLSAAQCLGKDLAPKTNDSLKIFLTKMRKTLDPKDILVKCSTLKIVYTQKQDNKFLDNVYLYYKKPDCYKLSFNTKDKSSTYGSSFINGKFYIYFDGTSGMLNTKKVKSDIDMLKDAYYQTVMEFENLTGKIELSKNSVTVDGQKCRVLTQKDIDYMPDGIIKYYFNSKNYQLVKLEYTHNPNTKIVSTVVFNNYEYKTINEVKIPVSYKETTLFKNQPKNNSIVYNKLIKLKLNYNMADKEFIYTEKRTKNVTNLFN
jgi:hypothetical protein